MTGSCSGTRRRLTCSPTPTPARADLLRIEQLFHLTPREDKLSVIQPLWNAGLRSAPQMAFRGRQQLMRVPGLDPKAAARHLPAGGAHRLGRPARLPALPPAPQRPVTVRGAPAAAAANRERWLEDATTLPDWEALFGSTDGVECSHCESTISPAAYFVDNMAFVRPCRRQRRHRRQRPRRAPRRAGPISARCS